MDEPTEGWNSRREQMNLRVFGECPECGHKELLWIERFLIEGSLEAYHLVHTEVDDVYECEKCKHSWKEFRYL